MNFSPTAGRHVARVRWNRELKCFEMRCDDCKRRHRDGSAWWPLTRQFWDTRSLQRCRACEAERARAAQRAYDAGHRRPHRRRPDNVGAG